MRILFRSTKCYVHMQFRNSLQGIFQRKSILR